MTGLFPPLPDETRKLLNRLPHIIDEVFPLPPRYRAGLGRDVAELSRLLTSGREERGASYLGRAALLSAYLRYFLPWNIYRLSRLFTSLPLTLKEHDAINDLGAGPLTLAASLWISRSELRDILLEFRCLDRTGAVLEAGKKLFAALTQQIPGKGSSCPWTIKTIRGELRPAGVRAGPRSGLHAGARRGGLSVEIKGKPAALSAAVNVYNELFWDFPHGDKNTLESFAERQARLLSALTDRAGSILVVEPGIPRCGEFISLLRESLMAEGRNPLAPCVHSSRCPLSLTPGGRGAVSHNAARKTAGKAKWCHFAFDTEDAPHELHKLSIVAQIPKERAVLSFIFSGEGKEPALEKSGAPETKPEKIRIISDSFPVDNSDASGKRWGRYGCCEKGLVLVTGGRRQLERSPSGALERLPLLKGVTDAKSGAFMADIG